jgi:hypothetical protein
MNLEEFDNYPQSDGNDELEEISIDALRIYLPKDKFQLRDERVKDKGVDLSLEIKRNGKFLNFRAQVQAKGTRSTKINKDGSVSLSGVETSNLNYLLSNPISLYILYIEPRKEFRFVWAIDEFKRITNENPEWFKQETVTLRFKDILDSDNLEKIYQHIIRKGTFNKNIDKTLSKSSAANVVLQIDASTLAVTDPEQVREELLSNGFRIIMNGYAEAVLEKIGLLKANDKEIPKIQIIKAYAEYELGHYQTAKDILARLRFNYTNLSDEDSVTITYVELICDVLTGSIDFGKYVEELRKLLEHKEKLIPFDIEGTYLLYAFRVEKDVKKKKQLLEDLRSKTRDLSKDSINEADLHNKMLFLEAEGQQISVELSDNLQKFRLKYSLGGFLSFLDTIASVERVFHENNNTMNAWSEELSNLLKLTTNPLLIGNIFCIYASILFFRQTSLLLVTDLFPHLEVFDENTAADLKSKLELAMKLFSENGNDAGVLRAKSLFAQLFDFMNQSEEADKLNSDTSKLAHRMSNTNVKFVSENPLRRGIKKIYEKRNFQDRDMRYAELTDETISVYAKQRIKALDLPDVQVENVKNGMIADRDAAIERLNWCKDFQLIQESPRTFFNTPDYSVNANRSVTCSKYKYESAITNPDWKLVISVFKKTYCENCLSREPKLKKLQEHQ